MRRISIAAYKHGATLDASSKSVVKLGVQPGYPRIDGMDNEDYTRDNRRWGGNEVAEHAIESRSIVGYPRHLQAPKWSKGMRLLLRRRTEIGD